MFDLLEAGAKLNYPEIQITEHEKLIAGKENWERFTKFLNTPPRAFEVKHLNTLLDTLRLKVNKLLRG